MTPMNFHILIALYFVIIIVLLAGPTVWHLYHDVYRARKLREQEELARLNRELVGSKGEVR